MMRVLLLSLSASALGRAFGFNIELDIYLVSSQLTSLMNSTRRRLLLPLSGENSVIDFRTLARVYN